MGSSQNAVGNGQYELEDGQNAMLNVANCCERWHKFHNAVRVGPKW